MWSTHRFGCLDTNPFGTNEKIIPYGIGTGPSNASLNMRVSKVIGIGPKVEGGRLRRQAVVVAVVAAAVVAELVPAA